MKSSYFKKLSAMVLSLAICVSFMPFVSATAYAADGEWYLIAQGTDNTYYIDFDEGADTADIDVRDYFIINADETSDDPMTYDSFSYQWSKYSEDEGYVDLEGETGPTFTAAAGSYLCEFTDIEGESGSGYAFFSVGETEEYYDGYWYLTDEGDYSVVYGKNDSSVILNAKDKIVIEDFMDDDPDNDLSVDDFEFKWYKFDGEESYEELEGQTGATLEVPAEEGDYSCRITNSKGYDDDRYAYFYVYQKKVKATSFEFTSNGIHELKEYTNGDFTQDGTYDANNNFTPQTDYYFYYHGWFDDDEVCKFNIGDKITLKYEDNTTDVYTYQTNTYKFEDDGESYTETFDEFTNSEGRTIYAEIYLNGEQTYATRLGVGSKVQASIRLEDYYDEDDYSLRTDVKDFAQIVKNPGAAWVNGAFYRLNYYEKSAELIDFYKDNVTEFTIPARVAMGDGKEYPVRRISSYIWYGSDPLKSLTVPSGIHSVGEFAFGLGEKYDEASGKWVAVPIEGFKLYAPTGSAAYEYAKEFGINVIDNNTATNGSDLAAAKAEAEAKAKEAEAAKADAAAKAAEAEAAKGDSGAKAQEAAAAKAEAEAKAKEAEDAKNEVAKLKAKLKKVSGFKAAAKKKGKAQLSWKKTAGVKGYQIYRSTKKTSGFKKVATIKKNTTKKWSDKKLKKGKKYYYKIRTYTVVNGKNVYGLWSDVKMITGKK